MTRAVDELQRRLGPNARRFEALARQASSRIGGPADLYFMARTRDALTRSIDAAEDLGVPWHLIGSASNVLISDDGVEGLVVKVATSGMRVTSDAKTSVHRVEAEAGCIYAAVAKNVSGMGLGGLEWAINVPGTVGAAVVNNSGAFGSATAERLVEALIYVPGQGCCTVGVDELGLAYRTSRLKRGELRGIVLSATYAVEPGSAPELRVRMREVQLRRRATQPSGYSLGSMFMNPEGDSAGRLIDDAGLKLRRVGGAEVAEQHANFFLNRGAATARDVRALMAEVQEAVWARTGVWLTPEVQFLGRWEDADALPRFAPEDGHL